MHSSILPVTIPPPPRQPRGQVQPFGPGCLELFEAVLSRGEGGRANRKQLLVVLVKYVTSRLTPDHVEKTAAYFQGEFLKFVVDWLEKNNLSKLKSALKVLLLENVKRMCV